MSDWNWVDLFPLVFFPLKLLVLGIGMFFAVKWHYDQGKKKRENKEQPKRTTITIQTGRNP